MSDFRYECSLVLREKIILCNVERQEKKQTKKMNEKFPPDTFPSDISLNESVL